MNTVAHDSKTLYHGSSSKFTTLFPHPARGIGSTQDKLTAVYAIHKLELAIAFALPKRPNAQGHLAWQLEETSLPPKIIMEKGKVDISRAGYLHHVSAESFEAIDDWQWVCFTTVKPIKIEIIRPEIYTEWVVYKTA
ncbi:MAG: hypothetical protein AAF708_08605 [Deinococcota bacterium]